MSKDQAPSTRSAAIGVGSTPRSACRRRVFLRAVGFPCRQGRPLVTSVSRNLRQWPFETGVGTLALECRHDRVRDETVVPVRRGRTRESVVDDRGTSATNLHLSRLRL